MSPLKRAHRLYTSPADVLRHARVQQDTTLALEVEVTKRAKVAAEVDAWLDEVVGRMFSVPA